jgi:hypothetical protein
MWLILLLLATSAGVAAAEPIRLGIYLQSPSTTSEATLESFRAEVEQIIGRPGALVLWREQISSQESFHRVLVVRLRGGCSACVDSAQLEPATLGSTHVSNGKVQPFIEISCDRIKAALSRNWAWPGSRVSAELLGRALARVAAHEMFHALTESVDHEEVGLMKPSFDRIDLAGRRLELSQSSTARLDRALGLGAFRAD